MKGNKKFYKKIVIWATIIGSVFTVIGVLENTSYKIEEKELESSNNVDTINGGQVAGRDIINNNFDNTNVEKEATIQFQDIDFRYVEPRLKEKNSLWMLGNGIWDEFSPCSINLLITNENSLNEIQLTNLKLIALNIKRLDTPRLICKIVINDQQTEVGLSVKNIGWGDAHNITINLTEDTLICSDENYKMDDIFDNLVLANIPLLQVNDEKYTTIFTSEEIKQMNLQSVCIFPMLNISSNEISNLKYDEFIDAIYINVENESYPTFYFDGGWGDSLYIYGMMIDARKKEDIYESNISECIPAGNLLNMPIIFFPNRSCELDFYFEIEVVSSAKKYTIKTEILHRKFDVVPKHDGYFDGKDLTFSEYQNYKIYDEELISYPFQFD